jgi:hypothetical protein
MAPQRGRPRGLNLNPVAVEDLCEARSVTKAELAAAGGISAGHLADALYRQKGVSPTAVRGMAGLLGVHPPHLAPELTGKFLAAPKDKVRDAA